MKKITGIATQGERKAGRGRKKQKEKVGRRGGGKEGRVGGQRGRWRGGTMAEFILNLRS